MAYGTLKCDNIVFDNGGTDKLVTVSGLFFSTSGALTVTGTISGGNVTAPTATFTTLTGTTTAGTTATFTSGSFTTLTGTTVTGTTANFVSGVFTTQISGATITGTTVATTTGSFVSLTGTTATFTSGIIASGRLLVGTSSARSNFYLGADNITPFNQVETTTNSYSNGISLLNYSLSGYPPTLNFGISQTNTTGTNVLVGTTDLGIINFTGNDGTNFRTAATIRATTDGTAGSGDMPGRLVFSTTADGAASPTERMRITQAGHCLIGTAAVGLENSRSFAFVTAGAGTLVCNHNTANTNGDAWLDFGYNGTRIGSITQNGTTAVAYNTSSDYRLKENVTPVPNGITRLLQLKPSRFNFIADPDRTVDGFIAHEVQPTVPEAITGEKDAVDADGNPVYQGIDQSKLVPLLTAALQEAIARIETLETRLSTLEGA